MLRAGYGDVEAAFAASQGIVTLDLTIRRHSAVPIETRGALARFDGAMDVLELMARPRYRTATATGCAHSAAARRRWY